MASVNFEKLKTPQQVKAMLRHCDGEERMEANHSNIDIDKSKTSGNMQGDLDYTAACQKYSERIAFLDAKPGANNTERPGNLLRFECPRSKRFETRRREGILSGSHKNNYKPVRRK